MKARELIAAIVVASILAIVLATVLTRQREDGLRATASRNLQQWGIALNLYLIDNGNQLPELGGDPVNEEQVAAWYNALPPYLARPSLASLPAGNRPRPGVQSLFISPASKPVKIWDPEVFYFNYAMNRFLQPEEGVRSFKIFELEHPSSVVFLGEVDGFVPWMEPGDVVAAWGGKSPKRASGYILFCDGHVELVLRTVLVSPESLQAAAAAEGNLSWFKE